MAFRSLNKKVFVAALLIVSVIAIQDGLYKELGVEISATRDELKAGYENSRTAAKGDQARLNRIERAFRILNDRSARSIYDTDGEGEVRNYESLGIERASQRYRKGPAVQSVVEVSLEESRVGVNKKVKVRRTSNCNHCQGSGALHGNMHRCPHCHGRGQIFERINQGGYQMQFQRTCPHCNGQGKHKAHNCPVCAGKGQVQEEVEIEINIPGGVINGEKIVMLGEGSIAPQSIPGDLITEIRIATHSDFRREDNNLVGRLNLTFKEAILGFKKKVKVLNGSELEVSQLEPSQHGSFIDIPDQGFPFRDGSGQRGVLRLVVEWRLPEEIDQRQKNILEEILDDSNTLHASSK